MTIATQGGGENGGTQGGGETSPPPPPPAPSGSPPIANFTYTPENPLVGEEVTFIDTSTDPDNDITSRTWTINGETFSEETVTYVFTEPAIYVVSLVVMDSQGNIDIIQRHVSVTSPQENQTQTLPEVTNVTLHIEAKDKNNNTLSNVKIVIYDENNTVVQTVYTNESGIATVTLPVGSYKIKAFYRDQTETKNMEFHNDGRVIFLFSPTAIEEKQGEQSNNTIFIAIPIIVAVGGAFVWFWLRRR